MKTVAMRLCLIVALLSLQTHVLAQSPTVLADFEGSNGTDPEAPLLLSGNVLFGTTYSGGASNAGTVFAYNLSTSNLSTVYSFTGDSDGLQPEAGLILSGNLLYGTTTGGGANGAGGVFAVTTNGNSFSNIYNFTGGYDGSAPQAGLVLSSNTLYGVANFGGASGYGTVFSVTTNGTNFLNLHSFTGGTNGANPQGTLVLSGTTLYGTTAGGGSDYGTVFAYNIANSNFANLHTFQDSTDGAYPQAGLLLIGSTLFGTANGGGSVYGYGTVFQVNTNGNSFQSAAFSFQDGSNPQSGLVLLGSMLYGTTTGGGSDGWGTVFMIYTNGTGLTNIYAFTDGSDGSDPEAGLVLSGSTLYGTTGGNNAYGDGEVFAIAPSQAVMLNYTVQNGQVTFTWGGAPYYLQSAPAVNGTYTNITGASSPYTIAVTNGTQFFRLSIY